MHHCSIFVGNLAFGAMESEVHELFAQYGRVESVRFMMDWERGRFRGFGFVTMPAGDACRAIEKLMGTEFQGRKLRLNLARPGTAAPTPAPATKRVSKRSPVPRAPTARRAAKVAQG